MAAWYVPLQSTCKPTCSAASAGATCYRQRRKVRRGDDVPAATNSQSRTQRTSQAPVCGGVARCAWHAAISSQLDIACSSCQLLSLCSHVLDWHLPPHRRSAAPPSRAASASRLCLRMPRPMPRTQLRAALSAPRKRSASRTRSSRPRHHLAISNLSSRLPLELLAKAPRAVWPRRKACQRVRARRQRPGHPRRQRARSTSCSCSSTTSGPSSAQPMGRRHPSHPPSMPSPKPPSRSTAGTASSATARPAAIR